MRYLKIFLSIFLVSLLAVAFPAPATAATVPAVGKVGLVTFTGAGVDKNGKASLTIRWPKVSGASGYEVFYSTNYDDVLKTKTVKKVGVNSATVTGLKRGVNAYFQVRAINKTGKPGSKSNRVGHGTMNVELVNTSKATQHSLLTWNVCSYACSGISSRTTIINSRISELKPNIVLLQEASKYVKAPKGYAFGVKGQNAVLYQTSKFTVAKNGKTVLKGTKKFANKYGTAGKGAAWVVLIDKKTKQPALVYSTHLITGSSKTAVKQRAYETTQLTSSINATLKTLKAKYPKAAKWTSKLVYVGGDMNTNKSRAADATVRTFNKNGWLDAYDQARSLTNQHYNSANPTWSTKPVISTKWGDHVDKFFVQGKKTQVVSWGNVGKTSNGKFTKLGSDHHPVMVVLKTVP